MILSNLPDQEAREKNQEKTSFDLKVSLINLYNTENAEESMELADVREKRRGFPAMPKTQLVVMDSVSFISYFYPLKQ